MTTHPSPRVRLSLLTVSVTLLTILLSGCQYISKIGKPAASPTPEVVATPAPPAIDYATLKPNELGTIPVVMYHEIAGVKNDKMHRTVASFQKDLQLLYDNNYRPVNLSDAVKGRIDVPAGKKPVVLTFDDSRKSQFILTETNTEQQIDPQCAVGILEDFSKEHPDWSRKATFFVLPAAKNNVDSFGQKGLGGQKMEYLQGAGYEIGNHTYLHKSLRSMTALQIQEALGRANNEILKAYPGTKISVFAVPMGQYPHNKKLWGLLKAGTYKGTPYNHVGVMDAAWRPMYSPFSKKFNAIRLERITPEDINFGLAYWVKQLEKNQTSYVSDGDPTYVTYPSSEAAFAEPARIQKMGLKSNPYGAGDAPGGGKKPITIGAKPIAVPKPVAVGVPPKPISAPPKPISVPPKPVVTPTKPIHLTTP
jgi:peptidoglycan/xylan/chitin deacetylase (PgdA/CDA1 family)